MKFETTHSLEEAFLTGSFTLSDTITVNETQYTLKPESPLPLQLLFARNRAFLLYEGEKDDIVLGWNVKSNTLVPAGICFLQEKVDEKPRDDVLGKTVHIKITNLPSATTLLAKVDSGATICSLHADRWKINGSSVQFVSSKLSQNVITVPIVDQQAVKSADGGTEYRPVIELNIRINDKILQHIKFNLNDRSNMEHAVLLGQNALEKGRFLIDPMKESIDWDKMNVTFESTHRPINSQEQINEKLNQLYEIMKSSDITFTDLIKHIRTNITESLDDLTY